jgi:hypothetical protein
MAPGAQLADLSCYFSLSRPASLVKFLVIKDCPWLRNPFGSLHAVALADLGEITSGVPVVAALGQRSLEPGVTARGIVQ